jgi:flagellar biosynthesis chaperone FliJ
MKNFKFRLQRVLDIKALEKDAVKRELLEALRVEREIEGKRDIAIRELVNLDGSDIQLQGFIVSGQVSLISLLEEKLREATSAVAEVRERYREALRNHEIFVKLKEAKEAKFIEEEKLKEERVLDELVIQGFGKRIH